MTQGGTVDYSDVIITLHNLAFCYQKTEDLPKSAAYIEACIYNADSFPVFSKNLSEAQVKIKKLEYLTKIHLQSCAVLSQIQDHKQALIHSKKAVTYANSLIKTILQLASINSSKYLKLKKSGKTVPMSLKNLFSIISLVNPALQSIDKFLKSGKLKFNQIPSVLGVKEPPE